MTTRSSILAGKTPCTEEPDGLQSMRLQSRTSLNIAHMCTHSTEIVWVLRRRKVALGDPHDIDRTPSISKGKWPEV